MGNLFHSSFFWGKMNCFTVYQFYRFAKEWEEPGDYVHPQQGKPGFNLLSNIGERFLCLEKRGSVKFENSQF